MSFWTKEEYLEFAEAIMDRLISYYAFEVLYWCGIREGELLALTPSDFDFEKATLRINKSYKRMHAKQFYDYWTKTLGDQDLVDYLNQETGGNIQVEKNAFGWILRLAFFLQRL